MAQTMSNNYDILSVKPTSWKTLKTQIALVEHLKEEAPEQVVHEDVWKHVKTFSGYRDQSFRDAENSSDESESESESESDSDSGTSDHLKNSLEVDIPSYCNRLKDLKLDSESGNTDMKITSPIRTERMERSIYTKRRRAMCVSDDEEEEELENSKNLSSFACKNQALFSCHKKLRKDHSFEEPEKDFDNLDNTPPSFNNSCDSFLAGMMVKLSI